MVAEEVAVCDADEEAAAELAACNSKESSPEEAAAELAASNAKAKEPVATFLFA